ncbi:MAG: excisionase family DNA-binding protein [Chloroflexia bacterium]|nr:excisionase family DNA-binding protein [Chloroflexia bacterium]
MVSPVLARDPVAGPEDERAVLVLLERLLESEHDRAPKLVGSRGEEIELPETVVLVLRQVVRSLAQDQAVTVVPVHKQLTTQQAADLLNVSRPYLVQLLEAEEIPSTKTGTHRRIRLDDLLVYRQHRDEERQAALTRLTQMGQATGHYLDS